MGEALSRRALIRGKVRGPAALSAIRPPWAKAEAAFLAACTKCDSCLAACGENILVKDAAGYPRIDFNSGGCTFCGACRDSCEAEAFRAPTERPWRQIAAIASACLSLSRVECRSCEDFCEVRAIKFRPAVGGPARPAILDSECVGCGACVAPCPAGALSIVPLPDREAQPCA